MFPRYGEVGGGHHHSSFKPKPAGSLSVYLAYIVHTTVCLDIQEPGIACSVWRRRVEPWPACIACPAQMFRGAIKSKIKVNEKQQGRRGVAYV